MSDENCCLVLGYAIQCYQCSNDERDCLFEGDPNGPMCHIGMSCFLAYWEYEGSGKYSNQKYFSLPYKIQAFFYPDLSPTARGCSIDFVASQTCSSEPTYVNETVGKKSFKAMRYECKCSGDFCNGHGLHPPSALGPSGRGNGAESRRDGVYIVTWLKVNGSYKYQRGRAAAKL